VVDRSHEQYAGALSIEDAQSQVSGAVGQSGPNEEYVINTVDHLRTLRIRDHHLEAVVHRLNAL
jgi:cation transport protein ChaC